jgi:c(7)-type cytochrome triheme protein
LRPGHRIAVDWLNLQNQGFVVIKAFSVAGGRWVIQGRALLGGLIVVGLCACQPRVSESPPEPEVTRSATPFEDQDRFYSKRMAPTVLQGATEALQGLPADRMGRVDWVKALDQGLIQPRSSVTGDDGRMVIYDGQVIMRNTRGMDWVRFPHLPHTQWLSCDNCHDGLFEKRAGSSIILMEDIFAGRSCGVCHDKVAFSVYACERCHLVPQP